ncbi:hypothetical protein ACHAXM_012132 [Skeletonema potamos]
MMNNPSAQVSGSSSSSRSSSSSMDTTTTTVTCQVVKTKFEPPPRQQAVTTDAFSYYSNKFYRMRTLLLQDDGVEVLHCAGIILRADAATPKCRKGSQPIQDSGVRQTRLSFEVHPSLLLNDDFLRMYEQMESTNISDDEESVSGKSS